MSYTISEVATLLGVTPSTLRYYESEGLLPAVGRTSSGRRLFTDKDVEACRVIECLKRSGLSISQIRDFMHMVTDGDETLGDRLALFRRRREAVERDMRELKRVLDVLDYKVWYYEQAVANGTESAVSSMAVEEIPAKHRAARTYLTGSELG